MLGNIDAIKIVKGSVFKELNFDNNHLTEIRGFEIFSKLKRLSAVHNEIRRVELPSLQNLTRLDLSENQVLYFPFFYKKPISEFWVHSSLHFLISVDAPIYKFSFFAITPFTIGSLLSLLFPNASNYIPWICL